MEQNTIFFTIFLIFFGAALLSTIALYTRQSMLVAYMVLGILLGPWGLRLVSDSELVQKTGEIGIIFLLFLLGLNLQPQNLLQMFRKTTWVAIISSLAFAGVGFSVSYYFGYPLQESLIIGAAMMFSSTIIGLKLLPTTILHHQHTGEVMISVLLMQDLIAIIVLLLLQGAAGTGSLGLKDIGLLVVSLPLLIFIAFVVTRFVLLKLFARFDRIREYMFLLSIAWCLSMSVIASSVGLSQEIGAFIAGVSIAANPIALYISESLKPLRDFFLVMFFFSIGASFNLNYFNQVALPAVILAVLMLLLKPVIFRVLLRQVSETKHVAWEVGVRLGQISEFSLLVAYLGLTSGLLSPTGSYLIQAATIITFIVSSYFVVIRYPTPMALSERMRRD